MPRNAGDDDDDRVSAPTPDSTAPTASVASAPGSVAAGDGGRGDRTDDDGPTDRTGSDPRARTGSGGPADPDRAGAYPPSADRLRGQLRRYRRGRHSTKRRLDPRLGPIAAAVAVAAISGSAWAIAAPASKPTPSPATAMVLSDAAERAAAGDSAASRSYVRAAPPAATPQARSTATKRKSSRATRPSAAAKPPAAGTPGGAAAASPAAPSPTTPAPVGGLSQAEMNNAITVVRTGQQMNLPRRAFVIAIATALQESHLHNLANSNLPASLNHPNEGVGSDYDSVGLFQQRPNWGSVDQLMDPAQSARLFYTALIAIPGWDQLDVTVAAQRVQVSAFPDAYAKWQGLAEQIVTAIAG